MTLRAGTDHDWMAVGDLHHRSRADAYKDILTPEALSAGSGAAMGEYWTERAKWENGRLTVAERDHRIIGFTYITASAEPGVNELCAIHVDPAEVGTGVGRALMRDAMTALGSRAVLWVIEENERARRFYERAGWVPDGGRRDDAIGGQTVHHVRYSLVVGGSA